MDKNMVMCINVPQVGNILYLETKHSTEEQYTVLWHKTLHRENTIYTYILVMFENLTENFKRYQQRCVLENRPLMAEYQQRSQFWPWFESAVAMLSLFTQCNYSVACHFKISWV